MKRVLHFSAIGLIVLATAAASAGLAPGRAAAAVETNEWFSFTGMTESCSDGLITVDVDVHLLSRVTQDANGGSHLGSTITTFFRGESATGAQ
jgi:hypothetical protein